MTRKKKVTAKHKPVNAAPYPTVSLEGTRIVVAGCRWTASKKTKAKLLAAGATGIGTASKTNPGVIQFPRSAKARAAFEGAFGEPNEWGVETLPDNTRWNDSVGMAEFSRAVAKGMK